MFRDNSLKSVRDYFCEKLKDLYTEREIQLFFEWTCQDKFNLSLQEIIANQKRFSESELLVFRDIVKQLQKQVPIQYALGKSHFMGLDLKVGPGVLCPRPETEELVDLIVKSHESGQLLDIGTGSGAIPLAIKKRQSKIEVTGLDISAIALEYAKQNGHDLDIKANWLQMDIMSEFPNKSYDIIVSNPPYVLESDKKEMKANVLSHEPEEALFVSDDDPLKFYNRIAEICSFILAPGGFLYFEIHEKFGTQVKQLLESSHLVDVQILNDLQGKDRMVKAKKATPF